MPQKLCIKELTTSRNPVVNLAMRVIALHLIQHGAVWSLAEHRPSLVFYFATCQTMGR